MKKDDGWIDEVVGAICDPIIVMPGGWGDTLPEWIKQHITVERLLENIVALREQRNPVGTDAEAVAYLYTATLTAPCSHDWADIYMHLMGKVMKSAKQQEMPADLRRDVISDYQRRMLSEFKHWLYEARVKARRERRREEKAVITIGKNRSAVAEVKPDAGIRHYYKMQMFPGFDKGDK